MRRFTSEELTSDPFVLEGVTSLSLQVLLHAAHGVDSGADYHGALHSLVPFGSSVLGTSEPTRHASSFLMLVIAAVGPPGEYPQCTSPFFRKVALANSEISRIKSAIDNVRKAKPVRLAAILSYKEWPRRRLGETLRRLCSLMRRQ